MAVVTGNGGNNTLNGNGAGEADLISGLGGDDTLIGFSGDDTLLGGTGADQLIGSSGNDRLEGEADNDNLYGASGIDTLLGGAGDDSLAGGSGSDLLVGGAGADLLDGGTGIDTADYSANTAAIVYSGFAPRVREADGSFDTLVGIDVLRGTAFADRFLGGGGDETFIGGAGNDYFEGNGGFDAVDYGDATASVTINLLQGFAQGDATIGRDTLREIDLVVGGSAADIFLGSSADEQFEGRAGNDRIDGGAGIDRAIYDTATTTVTASLATGIAESAELGRDTLIGIEQLVGGAAGDTLTGAALSPLSLFGGYAYRTDSALLRGLGGSDTLSTAARTDFAIADYQTNGDGPITVNLTAGTAAETGGTTDTLTRIWGVIGTRFDDSFQGTTGADFFRPGEGNDTVVGGLGIDRVSFADTNAGPVTVDLRAGTAVDGFGTVDTLSGIEAIAATAADDTLLGDGQANWFDPGDGNDTIDGRFGVDTVVYFFNDNPETEAGVTIDLRSGLAQGGRGDIDTLVNIENAIGSAFADTILGSGLANTLFGHLGNDRLDGRFGSDVLQGGAGADTLVGGGGADRFRFAAASDSQASTGIDRILDFTVTGPERDQFVFERTPGETLFAGIFPTGIALAARETIAFAAGLPAIQASIDPLAASGAVLQVKEILVTAGAAAGRYLYVNDNDALVDSGDMLIGFAATTTAALTSSNFFLA